MQVRFELPDDVARALTTEPNSFDRTVLESLALEGYRSGLLAESQVMRLPQMPSRFAVHDWLRERRVPYRYTETDLSEDLADLTELG